MIGVNMERWKDIPGFDGYQVSDKGNIKSFRQNKNGKLLSPSLNSKGYLCVNIRKDGKSIVCRVHRLVLLTFKPIENSNEMQVNHINEIKTDNSINNLEWVTAKENSNHGTRNIRGGESRKCPISQYKDGRFVRSFDSSIEASKALAIPNSSISKVLNGQLRTTHGFTFMKGA